MPFWTAWETKEPSANLKKEINVLATSVPARLVVSPSLVISQAALSGRFDQAIDAGDDYYYVCIYGTSWAKIPLVDSELNYNGYTSGDKVIRDNFVHVYTSSGWKKFAITQ